MVLCFVPKERQTIDKCVKNVLVFPGCKQAILVVKITSA